MSKSTILQEIMSIDREIKQLERDATYIKIKKNLNRLEGGLTIGANIVVSSPEDLKNNIRVRKNSIEMQEILKKFKERQAKYKDRLEHLYSRKSDLVKKLFG